MIIRELTADERFEASLITTVSFHGHIDDIDALREESVRGTEQEWGAFTDDGVLMGHAVNRRRQSNFDGHVISNGGIGCVSTLPEYRNSGAIRAIFQKMLFRAYENGEVISTLYPFNHAFYQKLGYDTICWRNDYALSPGTLANYRFDGRVTLWKPGDAATPFTDVYNRFAKGYNLSILRDDAMTFNDHLKGEYYKDRKFCYMLWNGDRPLAYLIFYDVRRDKESSVFVRDIAWDGPGGLNAILGFLSRFAADYALIEFFLPKSLELFSFVRAADAFAIKKTGRQDYMARVIDARKLLSLMKKPDGSGFTIRVSDGLIPQNNGTFRVDGSDVRLTDLEPDLIVSERALAQMAAGSVDLNEAAYRPDVRILSNEKTQEQVFIRKPILVEDKF